MRGALAGSRASAGARESTWGRREHEAQGHQGHKLRKWDTYHFDATVHAARYELVFLEVGPVYAARLMRMLVP